MAKPQRFRPVKDEEISTLVDRAIKTSVGFYDSKLSRERQDVLDYYNGKKPLPLHSGNSKYVSMDVFDAVESLKAVLLETFSAGSKIVSFGAQGPEDVEDAKVATEYTDYIIHRQNDSFQIFSDLIQDGLMARVGVVKVYWDERKEEVQESFEDIELEQLEMLAADPNISEVKAEMDEATGLFSGEVTRIIDKSQVQIDVIPPEEFGITPQARSIADADIIYHRTRKTRSDLLKMGFPAAKVNSIGAEDDSELTLDPEVLARHESIGADRLNLDNELQEQSKYVMVYECYMHLDREGTGTTKLHKIMKSGNVILDIEEVDCAPFLSFCPLPVSHSFYGSNYAARVIPTQNARTVLMRGILDHTVITNNPRYMVVKGSVTNPKELIENRFGGLVNVTRPDGILPFPQTSLNPFVFQTIQLLDEDKEEVTGVSRLSQGLNKDAISKQNSQGMVNDMVSLSQQREKVIARNFASFVKKLYLKVYELALGNENAQKIIEVAGQFKPIDPTTWRERKDMEVELKLGYGEQEREAQKYMGIHAMLAQDPGAAPFYQLPNKHAMYATIIEKMGVKNTAKFLTPIEQVPPPQPDPMVMKQMELEERKVVVQESVAQTSQMKVEMNAQIESMRVQVEQMAKQMEAMSRERELDRKEYEAASKNAIAVEELAMAQRQAATSPENTTAIISPNS
jgi:hypothetical protein